MDSKVIKGGIIGGLIVFVWGIFSWMILPWHERSLHHFKDEKKVYEVIKENAPESGIYIMPNMYAYRDGMSRSEKNKMIINQQKMMVNGPVMFASVAREGVGKMMFQPFIISLIIQMIGAGIITWMLLQTKIVIYKKQVEFFTVAGVLVGVLGILPAWNWWAYSTSYTAVLIADLAIGWCLAGFAVGKFLKR
jgi:hypothetical protein